MFSSVPTRLTLWYVAASALVLAGVGAAAQALLAHRLHERLDASLQSGLRVIGLSLRHEVEEHETQEAGEAWFRRLLGTLHQVTFSRQGIAVFENQRPVARKPGVHGYIPSRPESSHANAAAPFYTTQYRAGTHYRVAVASAPVPSAGTVYTVVIADSLEANETAISGFRRRLLAIIAGVLALTGAGGFLLVRKTLAPVLAMSQAVDRMTAKDLQQRLRVENPDDELGRLAATFNRLLARLHASFEQQLRFMADASHELRTPVSIVRTAAEVALESPETSGQDYREALAMIRSQAGRLSRLVNDMLLLARADAGMFPVRPQNVYLDELVQHSARAVRVLAARKNVSIETAAPGEAPCYGDEGLLRQLLIILLDNAVKYTPGGGTVRISLEREPAGYLVRVADSGPGIAPEAQPHIFDRFYCGDTARSHREGSGAGLGLAIGRWIAEAHRGSLELTGSGPGGSVFTLRLPSEEFSKPAFSLSSI